MGLLVPKSAHSPSYRKPLNGKVPKAWGASYQRNALHALKDRIIPDKFAWDDLAQQIVGALVLAAPLAVTEEVWRLSGKMGIFHILAIFGLTLMFNILLLYFAKYQVVEKERILGVIPLRLFSQMVVSYLAAGVMLTILGVIGYEVVGIVSSLKLIVFVGLFSNIGAGAADLLK